MAAGDYPAGQVFYANKEHYPFGIREDEFIQHVGIFGRSGSGKTNLAYLLVLDLVKAGKPFLVFDWKRTAPSSIRPKGFRTKVYRRHRRSIMAPPIASRHRVAGSGMLSRRSISSSIMVSW